MAFADGATGAGLPVKTEVNVDGEIADLETAGSFILLDGVLAIVPDVTTFRRGDCNDDGNVDISDPIATLGALFLGEGEITCSDACDSNDDGAVDISDPVATLGALFLGHAATELSSTRHCGFDSTEDPLGCDRYESCP